MTEILLRGRKVNSLKEFVRNVIRVNTPVNKDDFRRKGY